MMWQYWSGDLRMTKVESGGVLEPEQCAKDHCVRWESWWSDPRQAAELGSSAIPLDLERNGGIHNQIYSREIRFDQGGFYLQGRTSGVLKDQHFPQPLPHHRHPPHYLPQAQAEA
jgi:hypothetical protein